MNSQLKILVPHYGLQWKPGYLLSLNAQLLDCYNLGGLNVIEGVLQILNHHISVLSIVQLCHANDCLGLQHPVTVISATQFSHLC